MDDGLRRLQTGLAFVKANATIDTLDMNDWIRLRRVLRRLDTDAPTLDEVLDCGTACCMAGWMCLSPELQAEGLHLRLLDNGRYWVPHVEGIRSWAALYRFFNLSHREASWLFDAAAYEDHGLDPSLPNALDRFEHFIACKLDGKPVWEAVVATDSEETRNAV